MKNRSSQLGKRTWFQFKLRTLAVTVPVICAASYWAINVYQDHLGRAAKAELMRLGVTISLDDRGHHVVYDGRDADTFVEDALIPLRHIRDLESVEFSFGFPITDSMVSHLKGLKSLKRLSFSGSRSNAGITDSGLAQLSSLASLESLTLKRMAITDYGLRHLRHLPNLEELSLEETQTTEHGMVHLQSLHRLQKLNLLGTRISADGFKQIARLVGLVELSVFLDNNGDGLKHLGELKSLKALNFYGHATDAALVHIDAIPWLEELSLVASQVTNAGMRHVGCLMDLRKLDLARTRVSDDGLRHLGDLKKLEYLSLFKSPSVPGSRITDEGCRHLAHLCNLRELVLTRSALTNDGVSVLANSCKRLEVLCLRDSRVGVMGIHCLTGLTNLRRLDVALTMVGDDGLKSLHEVQTLEEVSIEGSYLDDNGEFKPFSSEAIDQFVKALPNCKIDWSGSDCIHSKYGEY